MTFVCNRNKLSLCAKPSVFPWIKFLFLQKYI